MPCDPLLPFIAIHASQLHALRLPGFDLRPGGGKADPLLGALTSLKVERSSCILSEDRLKTMPSLTSLSLRTSLYSDEEVATPAFPFSLITAVDILNDRLDVLPTVLLLNLLTRCTNLRKLTLCSSLDTWLPASVLPGLHKLRIDAPLDLTEASNLRSLCCIGGPPTMLPLAMPHLRHLEMHCDSATLACGALYRFLRVAPHLESLTLKVHEANEKSLLKLLEDADEAGLCRIRLDSHFSPRLMQLLQTIVLRCELILP